MCNNALLYNGPDTIYYKSADKMLSIGLKTLSKVLNTNFLFFYNDWY